MEVDVGPGKTEQLTLAQAGEDRSREDRPVGRGRLGQQRVDLLRAEDPHLPADNSWAFAAFEPADRVVGDQATTGRVGEDPAERDEDAAHSPAGQSVLLELEDQLGDPVLVDLANPAAAEPRKDVAVERGAVDLARPWP